MWCFDTTKILRRYTAIKFEISRLLPQLQQGRIKMEKQKKTTKIKHNILKILISLSYKNMWIYEGPYIEL